MNNTASKYIKAGIWLTLGAIVFSPLFVSDNLFFPFIVTKTLIFNVGVEFLLLLFLALVILDNKYKWRFNFFIFLFFGYLATIIISSLLGDNFYNSFFSNSERSEGILLLFHLFVFSLICVSFLRTRLQWRRMFDLIVLSGVSVSLVALAQYFKFPFVIQSAGGERLASTLGNASYLAGYLLFSLYLAVYLAFVRNHKKLRWYYAMCCLLFIFVIINTYTRGAILALLISGLIFLFYLCYWHWGERNGKYKKWAFVSVILIVGLFAIGLASRDKYFIKNVPALRRLTDINFNSETAKTRLIIWQSSWQGIKERPLFGWGYENAQQALDKYYNPELYNDAGAVVWFDRSHNMIFDRLLTGGLVGAILYLSLFVSVLYCMWRYYFFRFKNKSRYVTPVIFSLLLLSYIIQNLFVFESLAVYVPLFVVLAYLSRYQNQKDFLLCQKKGVKYVSLFLYMIIFLPVLYFINIIPVRANASVYQAMTGIHMPASEKTDLFIKAIEANTFGRREFVQQFGLYFNSLISSGYSEGDLLVYAAKNIDKYFDRERQRYGNNALFYLYNMKFNNSAYLVNPSLLDKNIMLFQKAIVLSPLKQALYYEVAYTYFNKHFLQDEKEATDVYLNKSLEMFDKIISLNPDNPEPYRQLAVVYSLIGQYDQARELADQAVEKKESYDMWRDGFVAELSR